MRYNITADCNATYYDALSSELTFLFPRVTGSDNDRELDNTDKNCIQWIDSWHTQLPTSIINRFTGGYNITRHHTFLLHSTEHFHAIFL